MSTSCRKIARSTERVLVAENIMYGSSGTRSLDGFRPDARSDQRRGVSVECRRDASVLLQCLLLRPRHLQPAAFAANLQPARAACRSVYHRRSLHRAMTPEEALAQFDPSLFVHEGKLCRLVERDTPACQNCVIGVDAKSHCNIRHAPCLAHAMRLNFGFTKVRYEPIGN